VFASDEHFVAHASTAGNRDSAAYHGVDHHAVEMTIRS
jgi:hypothetical protein